MVKLLFILAASDKKREKMDLEEFRINNVPATAYYLPAFISEQQEQTVLQHIDNTPKPKWTVLSNRQLINYGGIPHKNGMIVEILPKWLQQQVKAVNTLGCFGNKEANHVLVNEYLPKQGIMAHSDGPLFHPVVSTISCGSHTILRFYKQINDTADPRTDANECNGHEITHCLLLEPRSLLIIKDDLYHEYLHSIDEVSHDTINTDVRNIDRCIQYKDYIGHTIARKRRLSLTIRHVPKASKTFLRLGH